MNPQTKQTNETKPSTIALIMYSEIDKLDILSKCKSCIAIRRFDLNWMEMEKFHFSYLMRAHAIIHTEILINKCDRWN